MACNILNGASRACRKMNALLRREEVIYAIELAATSSNDQVYKLAMGTNEGRLIVVTLKQDMSWNNTRKSFITEYTVGYRHDPLSKNQKTKNKKTYASSGPKSNNKVVFNESKKQSDYFEKTRSKQRHHHHRKTSSKNLKYSVLTSRERCFREMADPITAGITYDSMKKYLWNESAQILEADIREFFEFMQPNKKNQISFTQFVQRVDEDGDFMRAFEHFCVTGSSRTDRRPWMVGSVESKRNESMDEEEKQEEEDDDSDWELAMLNERESNENEEEEEAPAGISAIVWSQSDDWIISGHQDGDIRFWSKEIHKNESDIKQNKHLKQSNEYYVARGSMNRHSESISSLSLSGTYLVSSSCDGNILIWHLDFLLPSVSLPMNISNGRGIIQLLASINSAHLGEEINDVQLSEISNNLSLCVPNALYLLSCGADQNVRCRDVMEILRQQLTLRILAESQQTNGHLPNSSNVYSSYHAKNAIDDDSDSSDFGATTYT